MKDYIGTKQWPCKGSIVKKKNLSFYACKTYSYMTTFSAFTTLTLFFEMF